MCVRAYGNLVYVLLETKKNHHKFKENPFFLQMTAGQKSPIAYKMALGDQDSRVDTTDRHRGVTNSASPQSHTQYLDTH